MRRALLVAAALAIPVSGVLLTTSQAWAGKPKPPAGSTTCSGVNGSVDSGDIQISGCVDVKGADTGGGTPVMSFAVLESGGTVTLDSGATVTFGAPTIKLGKGNAACPGGKSGSVTDSFKGTVTADTAPGGFKIPGAFSGDVCVDNSNTDISALKPLKIS